jgi:hypothetical protein
MERARPRTRRSEAGGLGGFVAFLLLAAATVLLVATTVLAAFVNVVLAPASWLAALDDSGAYEQAPAAIAEQLSASLGRAGSGIGPLEAADVRALVAAALPPAWLREQASAIVPVLVDGLASTGEIRGRVPLGPLKAQLTGVPLQAALVEQIEGWPACGAAQVQQLLSGTLVRCRPPAGFEDELALAVVAGFSVLTVTLPDEIDLASVVPGATGDSGGPGLGSGETSAGPAAGVVRPLRWIAAAKPMIGGLVAVTALLLAAAALFSGLTIRSTLRACAVPFLVGGLLVLLLAWLADPLLGAAVTGAQASVAGTGAAPGLVSIAGSIATAMIGQLHGQLLPSGALLAGAGGVLLSVRAVLAR